MYDNFDVFFINYRIMNINFHDFNDRCCVIVETMSNTFVPKKSREKQSDLRQFMFKRTKIQETSNPSPVDTNFGAPKTSDVPLQEDELVYDVELLPHDPGKRINIINIKHGFDNTRVST